MKALSLTQPWADAILEKEKRIENRVDRGPWRGGCGYRGPILIHAAKGLGTQVALTTRLECVERIGVEREWLGARFEWNHPARAIATPSGLPLTRWAPRPTLHRGGIVGRAQIVDVIQPGGFDAWVGKARDTLMYDADEVRRVREEQRKWWFGGFALVLDHVQPLPFVPWKGALGLFEVPDDYATRALPLEVSDG